MFKDTVWCFWVHSPILLFPVVVASLYLHCWYHVTADAWWIFDKWKPRFILGNISSRIWRGYVSELHFWTPNMLHRGWIFIMNILNAPSQLCFCLMVTASHPGIPSDLCCTNTGHTPCRGCNQWLFHFPDLKVSQGSRSSGILVQLLCPYPTPQATPFQTFVPKVKYQWYNYKTQRFSFPSCCLLSLRNPRYHSQACECDNKVSPGSCRHRKWILLWQNANCYHFDKMALEKTCWGLLGCVHKTRASTSLQTASSFFL